MAIVETLVWHDEHGNITAVGRAAGEISPPLQPFKFGDQRVLKVAIAEEQLHTLHLTHRIDVDKGSLARS